MNSPDQSRGSPTAPNSRGLGRLTSGKDSSAADVRPTSGVQSPTDDMNIHRMTPLPPIGSPDSITPSVVSSSVFANTVAVTPSSKRSGPTRRPRIVNNMRRETEEDEMSNKSGSSDRSKRSTRRREVGYVVGADGQERAVVSVDCQTEWSWLEDMAQRAVSRGGRPFSRAKGSVTPSQDGSGPGTPDVDQESLFSEESVRGDSALDASRKSSQGQSVGSRHLGSAVTTGAESAASEPYPSREDEYGIPVLRVNSQTSSVDDSSDSDSDDDSSSESRRNADTLPSIGPPQILQYQRESTRQDITVSDPLTRQQTEDLGQAKFQADPAAAGMRQVATGSAGMRQEATGSAGMFEGQCEFCEGEVQPLPSLGEQESQAPEDLYCCQEYNEFIQMMTDHPLHKEMANNQKIDVGIHARHGSKQARNAAKERAAQRMRERELVRQQAAMAATHVGAARDQPRDGGAGAQPGFYQFARQMKTINYQLSSQKCLDEGWTLRAPSPLGGDNLDGEVFEPEPMLPPWADGTGKVRERTLIQRYYEDGRKFLVLFPDGSGHVLYPSGKPAITIASTEPGMCTYIVQDAQDPSNVLAVFDPDAHATAYHGSGNIRLCLDPVGGLELDAQGTRKRRWMWKHQTEHVHAPPLQPITCSLSSHLALRVMSQDQITLTFSCRKRSCRFQVGARLKVLDPENLPTRGVDDHELFREATKTNIESIMTKVANLLKFPSCSRLEKLPLPSHLSSRTQKVQKLQEDRGTRLSRPKKEQSMITVN